MNNVLPLTMKTVHINRSTYPLNHKLKISNSDGTYFIEHESIVRIQSASNYSTIYTIDNPPILLSKSLSYLENELPPSLFQRIHASHLIGVKHLYKVTKDEVELADGSICPLSRTRKAAFFAFIS